MADDVAITAGSGTTIATDDAGGRHVQLFKLAISTDGSATLIPADATNGLDVDVTRWPKSGTATLANVSASASSVALQASNTARIGWSVYNDSTATLYVNFGATASATAFTVLVGPGGFYEMPQVVYTGAINGIWSSATGTARVTELT
jgi:hypothetical protein